MRRKPAYIRDPGDFKPGIIAPWPAGHENPEIVAQAVRYIPSGEHKGYPSATNLWQFGPRKGKALCDKYDESQWPKLLITLRAAISAPCVDAEFRGRYPSRAWAYIARLDGDFKLHEARLSNGAQGW